MINAMIGFDPRRAARFTGLSALMLFLCWQHIHATRLGYRVESSRHHARELRNRVADAQMRFDAQMAPAILSIQAATRLKMIPAEPSSLRVLQSDSQAKPSLFPRLLARGFSSLITSTRS